ncbi:MAG: hypothetical protein AB7O97_06755 [Planctomycetota bacterium]
MRRAGGGGETPTERRVPGWVVLLAIALFVGLVAVVIVLGKNR